MSEIYLALIEKASMREEHGKPRKRLVEYTVQEEPVIIDYERKQSPLFWLERVDELKNTGYAEIASHENPLRTHSAGAVSVFHDDNNVVRYVSFAQKDENASRDPGFRVSRNGFPQSEEDWFTNNHLYREAWEEGLILTKDYELIIPTDRKAIDIIYKVAEMLESKTGLKIKGEKEVPIIFKDGCDVLSVYKGDEKVHSDSGVISWTPETGFNFIKVMEVQYPISELLIVDGETLPDGTPIKRDICVIDLKHLKGKKFCDEIEENVHRYKKDKIEIFSRKDRFLIDKVSRSVLNQIYYEGEPVYPIDWMDESYEFLSNPVVLKKFSSFGWSELEKQLKVKPCQNF